MNGLFSLDGRTALVTGARKGIGQAVAVGLAEAGADLVLLGRTEEMSETADAVRAAGRKAVPVALDLARTDALEEACSGVLARHRVDILVNNAGIIHRGAVRDTSFAGWRTVLDVDLDAVFLLCRSFGAAMADRGEGKILNIASLLSFQGGVGVPAYTASKHAVAGLTKALANEWGPQGVQTNALAPGYIATDNTEPLRRLPQREAEIRGRIPAGRWGTPQDLVGASVFLAGPASDYVNGHVLVVDGGWMAR